MYTIAAEDAHTASKFVRERERASQSVGSSSNNNLRHMKGNKKRPSEGKGTTKINGRDNPRTNNKRYAHLISRNNKRSAKVCACKQG